MRSKSEIFLIFSWPIIFGLCTVVSIYANISIIYDANKAESIQQYYEYFFASKIMGWVTLIVGIAFVVSLFISWRKLANPNEFP